MTQTHNFAPGTPAGYLPFVDASVGSPTLSAPKTLRAFVATDVIAHDRLINPEMPEIAACRIPQTLPDLSTLLHKEHA